MGFFRRLQLVVASIIAISLVALIYAEVAKPLIALGGKGGKHSGFLSDQVSNVDTIVPLVLALLLLGIVVWFIVASVQQEKTVRRAPRR